MSKVNILEKMSEVIKQSLPQQAAEELKKYFEEHDILVKEHDELEKTYVNLTKRIEEYEKKDSEYNSLKNRERVLENKETELLQKVLAHEENVRNLEVEKLKYQLAEATKRSDDAIRFVDTLVRNPRSTEFWSSNKSTNVPYTDQYGNRMTDFQNINETITKDFEQTK